MDLNVCVVGCGAMGTRHADAWQARPDARVASVFDIDGDVCAAAAARLGARACGSYQEAILHEGVNVVSVCTPTAFHSEIACFAAEHGRHVLSEKPLANSLEGADAMIAAAARSGVLLSTSFQYRALPVNRRLKELFDRDAWGGPVFLRFVDVREVRPKLAMHRRSLNNGPVLDMAPHFFDLVRHFTGQEARQVFAAGHVFARGKGRVRDIPEGELAVDAAEIQVRYGGGHVLSLLLAWGMPEAFPGIHGSQIVGPDGAAHSSTGGFEIVIGGEKETVPGGVTGGGPGPRVNNLAEAIRGGARLEVTGEDGREALRVSVAAFQSIETGRVITLDAGGPPASSSR